MIKVMICDDLPKIFELFSEVVDCQEDMQVVCGATSTEEAVKLALIHKPDVILMDIEMDEKDSGIIATKRIMEQLPQTKVIMLTIHQSEDIIIDAYLAGAVYYIVKDANKEKMLSYMKELNLI